ncbi:RBBP9/YdeN family alpha/beta hydrolase [Nocardioides sediminis]|uniref:RBBP9/YdeN family alpha/beta hydrolase n=1 Tax=Nocardioides sediminis TaxID=433648 RepID=UPI000D303516|nr:alpha/beta hydrolase [Nocardioides sediminis]
MVHEPSTVVIVPGLRGDVPEHWQTILADRLPRVSVVDSFQRDKRDLTGRIADLQLAVDAIDGPVTIVAHSAGCLVTAHWARLTPTPVRAALLATPPDLARPLPPEYPTLGELRESGWLPVPTERLPFPSIVAGSSNDPLGEEVLVRATAANWGSHFVDVGAVGHLNPAAGYGDWQLAEPLLEALDAIVLAGARDADGALPPLS